MKDSRFTLLIGVLLFGFGRLDPTAVGKTLVLAGAATAVCGFVSIYRNG